MAALGDGGSVAAVLAAGIGTVKADDGARITAEKRIGAREVDITIASPALGRSVKARILLPKN